MKFKKIENGFIIRWEKGEEKEIFFNF